MSGEGRTKTSESAENSAGWVAAIRDCLPGATVRRVERLGGGLVAQTYAVHTTGGDVVVKRYRGRRGDTVPLEWERLGFVQRVAVPVPRPLACDVEGRWFGERTQALGMTRLAGCPDVRPRDVDGWLGQLASTLVAIHGTDPAGAEGALVRPAAVESWRPPTLRSPTPATDRAIAAIRRHLPTVSWRRVLTHGDFHPGNTLWHDGRVSGLADWSAARLAPAAYELAYCRADVALLLDRAAADRLTAHYVRRSGAGAAPADLPVFDLVVGLEAVHKSARMLRGYRQLGRTDSAAEFGVRADDFLRHALAEVGTP